MKRCVICGARVRNMNPRTVTCDPICTDARRNGLTRQQMIEKYETEPYPTDATRTGCKICGCEFCICAER